MSYQQEPEGYDDGATTVENNPAPVAMLQTVAPAGMLAVESSRAVAQIQAAMIIAKNFPRDINKSFTRIIAACSRYSLAERAFYTFPRGQTKVTGETIRLAEVLAQNYGNLDFGIVELERLDRKSVAMSYCWDLETNVRHSKTFEVPHSMKAGQGLKLLTDPRDIYEIVANLGARRLRSCIFGAIPIDLREDAGKQCRATLAKGKDGETIEQRIRRILIGFKSLGVDQGMLEKYVGHKIELTTGEELVDLTGVFNAIRDKQSKRGDFFGTGGEDMKRSIFLGILFALAGCKPTYAVTMIKFDVGGAPIPACVSYERPGWGEYYVLKLCETKAECNDFCERLRGGAPK